MWLLPKILPEFTIQELADNLWNMLAPDINDKGHREFNHKNGPTTVNNEQ